MIPTFRHNSRCLRSLLWGCAFLCASLSGARAELSFEPSWDQPDYETVRRQVLNWLHQGRLPRELRMQAKSLWPVADLRDADGSHLLELIAETVSLVDQRAKELVLACQVDYRGPFPPDASWLKDSTVSPWMRNNLSVYYARWLAQQDLFDEVILALEGLSPHDVVDPVGLLFYRMVAYHQTVHPEESRTALVQLMEREESLPRRYQQVAQLVSRDLAGLKDESLDHIARRMNDVRRRLELGRADGQVLVVEKSVVDSLDKLIKKIEEQQQQQSSSRSSGSQQGAQPMKDSQLPSMRAPMQVEQRDIGSQSGWGDLPPKEREQALQQVGREFPGHYRELIEQYFRELASESSPSESN